MGARPVGRNYRPLARFYGLQSVITAIVTYGIFAGGGARFGYQPQRPSGYHHEIASRSGSNVRDDSAQLPQEFEEMAETTPNPFENTNSGPTAPAPDAPVADAACCTVVQNARMVSRVLWYAPLVILFAGVVAVWAVPGLANFASPILNLIDPSLGTTQGAGCCSSTTEETGACCSNLSKGAMLTSSVSTDEVSLESEDGLPACCSGGEGLCPLSQTAESEKVSGSDASAEEAGK